MKIRDIFFRFTILITAVTLSMSCMAYGANTNSTSGVMSEPEALKAAQRWATALGRTDIAGLDELLHDEYMHIHATSMVESKAKFIGALKEGSRKYDPFTIEDSKVRVFGDSAVVTGKFALKATMREKTIERVNRLGLVMITTPSGVRIVSFQATSIPQENRQ